MNIGNRKPRIRYPRPQAIAWRGSRGFTLVELLVVVAIIVVLLALLVPAIDKAIYATENAKCLSNQRTIAMACQMYALKFNRQLPPCYMNGGGASGYDLRDIYEWEVTTPQRPKAPLALGLLVVDAQLPTTQLGKVIHCPCLDNTGAPDGFGGHCMDVIHTDGPVGGMVGGSWWVDPNYIGHRLAGSYNYRAASFETTGKGLLKTTKLGSTDVLTIDTADLRFGGKYSHPDGYNRAFADGHAGYFSDPDRVVDQMIYAGSGGKGYFDGTSNPLSDEAVYAYVSGDK